MASILPAKRHGQNAGATHRDFEIHLPNAKGMKKLIATLARVVAYDRTIRIPIPGVRITFSYYSELRQGGRHPGRASASRVVTPSTKALNGSFVPTRGSADSRGFRSWHAACSKAVYCVVTGGGLKW